MYSLFVALDLPIDIRNRLTALCGGLPGALWLEPSQFHLTLRYIGQVDGGMFTDVREALNSVRMDPLELTLEGVGFFPPKRRPTTIWAGVQKNEPLLQLRSRIDSTVKSLGLDSEHRKYAPHVTIGHFGGGPVKSDNPLHLAAYLSEFSLFKTEAFEIETFSLYSGARSNQGPIYTPEASYPVI